MHAKHCYALPRSCPALFCLISAEAVLLRGKEELPKLRVMARYEAISKLANQLASAFKEGVLTVV
jgi:hypothetical protein